MRSLFLAAVVVAGVAGGALTVSACATAGKADLGPPLTIADIADLEVQRPAATAFARALLEDKPAVRARAALALGRIERADATDAVLSLVNDNDAQVRTTAAWAVGQLDLALAPGDARRAAVEAALIARLTNETVDAARAAVLASLGRVGDAAARDALLSLLEKSSKHTERVLALYALGVNGARRGPTLSTDARLRGALNKGLAVPGEQVSQKTAAAYVVFRQGVIVDDALLSLAHGKDGAGVAAQAQIHLARALAKKETTPAVVTAAVAMFLKSSDWRVRTEALRALANHSEVDTGPAIDALNREVAHFNTPGAGHVIVEACTTLAGTGSPSLSLGAVEAAVAALPATPAWGFARCTCAGVVEILGGAGDALERCTASLPEVTQQLLSVDTIARARISSREREAALAHFFEVEQPKVRVAAASAMCTNPTEAAADKVASRLLAEDDPAVIGALLSCFADGRHRDVVKDLTLMRVANVLSGAGDSALEALISLAEIARARSSAGELRAALSKHTSPAVRDAARGVNFGERAAGPRAVVEALPSPATLPLSAVLKTSRGDITIAFDREAAPRTVKVFADLARKGALNNTPFHRVVSGFVSQGGDPRGDGSGGPGFSIPCERSAVPFVRGTVGIAHAGTDTGGSQFFLTHADQPHLDGRYTAFATITDGIDVMDNLQRDDLLLSVDFVTALRPR